MGLLSGGRAWWAALGAIVGALAAGGIAYAAIPGSGGVFHACYKTSGGQVRLVNSASDCSASEAATQWNQTGQTGLAGPTGPTGISGYEEKMASDTITLAPGDNQGLRGTTKDSGGQPRNRRQLSERTESPGRRRPLCRRIHPLGYRAEWDTQRSLVRGLREHTGSAARPRSLSSRSARTSADVARRLAQERSIQPGGSATSRPLTAPRRRVTSLHRRAQHLPRLLLSRPRSKRPSGRAQIRSALGPV